MEMDKPKKGEEKMAFHATRSLLQFVFVIAACFGLAACVPVELGEGWLIKLGEPGAGALLFTTGNSRNVDGACLQNELSHHAEGRIGQGPECTTGTIQDPHFHGTLYGKPDPNPFGCGWGRVRDLGPDFTGCY
jgi:hypothetical protein